MYSVFGKSKIRGYLFCFIIIWTFISGLIFVIHGLWPARGIRFESGSRNSRPSLISRKELPKNESSLLEEISKQDSSNNSGDSTKFILINSYMRSGSTFLGQKLGFSHDTFYYYEPLHRLWIYKYTKGSKLCHFTKPVCEYGHGAVETGLNFLSDVFNCKLQNHSEKLNQPLIRMFSGPKWNSFNKCISQHGETKDCLVRAEEQCVPTKFRVIKVLRMSLADVALLLPKHPNLVIVHLFRDPRGVFNSHIKTSWFPMKMGNTDAFVNDTITNCERIKEDLVMGKTLKTNFPARVKFVQYEDIYNDMEKIQFLFKSLRMDLPHDSAKFKRPQNAGRRPGAVEVDNLSGPFKYRMSLPFKLIQIIDKECNDALRMLGLRAYESEANLHDINFNPVDGKLPFEL